MGVGGNVPAGGNRLAGFAASPTIRPGTQQHGPGSPPASTASCCTCVSLGPCGRGGRGRLWGGGCKGHNGAGRGRLRGKAPGYSRARVIQEEREGENGHVRASSTVEGACARRGRGGSRRDCAEEVQGFSRWIIRMMRRKGRSEEPARVEYRRDTGSWMGGGALAGR